MALRGVVGLQQTERPNTTAATDHPWGNGDTRTVQEAFKVVRADVRTNFHYPRRRWLVSLIIFAAELAVHMR